MAKKRDSLEAEVVEPEPFAPTGSNRARASKLRAMLKAGGALSPEDAAWLADYDEARGRKADDRAFGASKSRRMSYTEEEQEAVGEGSAAGEVAAAGAMVREEGRRYDSLLSVGITALRYATDIQAKMMEGMIERSKNLEDAHVQMMRASASYFIRTVEAEAEIVRLKAQMGEGEEKKDAISEMVEQMMPFIMAKLGGAGGAGGG